MPDADATVPAARAVERLRLAEARLARRRQTECGPSETARAAMRYILERSDAGRDATPTEIAEHLGLSTASVTGILQRLRGGGLITFARNPDDGRSKRVVPVDRSTDLDDVDPLTAKIRGFAEALTAREAEHVARFLEAVTEAVDRECT
ncbi:MarR family winged helix-turn-helix transcriptional regulator [Microbacterium sulfonylureivorans]|uniref:MarR family winged helix-turn-helix transcriptional regulator n=1 Tax=Microbacterium sulfonylureivorans TaxID=2486854 RepID=UPI000FDA3E13|nr:MarR family transcriptional regulator [Microbacterium sulfonylureivorans]